MMPSPYTGPRMIFVNLPVIDVVRSTAFYETIGFSKNPQFSDASTSCMVLSDTINVMLLSHARFADFTPRPIADAHRTTQVLLAISANDRAAVDALVVSAVAAGGTPDPCTVQDHGFMYGRSFTDPDGHIWESIWMDDVSAIPESATA